MRILACDFSLRRPGFAVVDFNEETREAKVVTLSNVDNKNPGKKGNGQILSEIAKELRRLMIEYPEAVLVREKALTVVSRSAKTLEVLNKVVGVSDLFAWVDRGENWAELNPKTIKLLVTGNPNATKAEVAKELPRWVGEVDYDCDDESDAVAVAIAWLMTLKKIHKRPGVLKKLEAL